MERQCGHENPLQLISNAFGGDGCPDNLNQQLIAGGGRDQMPPVPLSLPHWINYQHASQTYVSESSVADIQREISYNNPGLASGFRLADSSIGMNVKVEDNAVLEEVKYPWPQNGGSMTNSTNAEYQTRVQNQDSSEPHSRVAVAAHKSSHKPHSCASRQRASAADRARRLKIAERIDALEELLPHPKEGDKASVLDDIIDYVKYLQLQIKDLSRSRLGGESTSDPFIFLEGYGHYLLHEQTLNEPLEEMMGKLLEVNPSAATQLLESRGLVIMPTALAEELNQAP